MIPTVFGYTILYADKFNSFVSLSTLAGFIQILHDLRPIRSHQIPPMFSSFNFLSRSLLLHLWNYTMFGKGHERKYFALHWELKSLLPNYEAELSDA